jgi:hypothetical protein
MSCGVVILRLLFFVVVCISLMPRIVIPDDGDAENGGCGGRILQRNDKSAGDFLIKFFYIGPERYVSIFGAFNQWMCWRCTYLYSPYYF